jgi:hypothetical protein
MVDYFTELPISIGEVYLNGCICAIPDAGKDYLVVESYFKKYTNHSTNVEQVLSAKEISEARRHIAQNDKSDTSFFILVNDSPQQKGYMFLNETHKNLSKNMIKENNLPFISSQDINNLMVSFVVHHEFKHAHDILSENWKKYQQEIYAGTDNTHREDMSDVYEIGKVNEEEYSIQKFQLKLEMQADAFGLSKALQQWVNSQDGPPENHTHRVDALLKSFGKANSLRDIATEERIVTIDKIRGGYLRIKMLNLKTIKIKKSLICCPKH